MILLMDMLPIPEAEITDMLFQTELKIWTFEVFCNWQKKDETDLQTDNKVYAGKSRQFKSIRCTGAKIQVTLNGNHFHLKLINNTEMSPKIWIIIFLMCFKLFVPSKCFSLPKYLSFAIFDRVLLIEMKL